MALNAVKETYIQQPAVPHIPDRQPVIKKRVITKGEKVLYLSFLAVFVLCAILILQNQAAIQASTQDIQTIEQKIDEKAKQNSDLAVQVSELSKYERIMAIAKEAGLKLDGRNIKVVSPQ
ncbi:cell division protein FtsL [Planococcus sp. YIM B11945]|uniref:cell division protein FtsL n=1 Tax=Planococcus sp. YIM B11945 TaxID=3435410 RepID=UPI003D7CB278